MGKTRIAVDVGGTFTDVCIMDEKSGKIKIQKTASTPDDPMRAIINGIEAAKVNLSDVEMFSHGTTVATNALITRIISVEHLATTSTIR